MCGIAGLVEPEGRTPCARTLGAMAAAMAHRGPDGERLESWGQAGFAFRRLAIIDVAGGMQPLHGEDGSCHVILNGEIYNHLDLRRQLEACGHRFRTRSDVEAVVHGYEEWGDSVVDRLRGMFALALWDERRRRLMLARDRLGKKPLVYHEAGGRIAFASELRALLQDRRVPREPDLPAIHHYLTYQYVPTPMSGFTGVRKVPPAHRLVFENGRSRLERYWSLSAQPQLRIAEQDAAAEVGRLLRDAVRVRLMSDVPLGAFLSGGIDSSAVVALMAEFGPVATFSVGFEEADFSELPFAREVAQRYGTRHHEFMVRPAAAEVLPALVEHYGEPYADSSALPTYWLSRVTATQVKVALNGDGGDEVFAGYDRYRALRAYQLLSRLPSAAGAFGRRSDALLARHAPVRVRRLLNAISARPEESYARTVSYFLPEEKQWLYSAEMREAARPDSFELLYAKYAESDAPDLVGRTLYADAMTYLPDDLLAKVDIASMAHGLEGRSPFLDHHLVEFAARLPSSLKVRRGHGKHILRKAVAELIPAPLLRRRKQGFAIPVSDWFRDGLRPLLRDALLSRRSETRPFFRPEAVRRLVEDHESGDRDHGPKLWALLMLELWCHRFLDAAEP